MSFLIELDEGTAARRRVPFRVFTSGGTAPDTGFSDATLLLSVNGAAQIVSAGSSSAISANAGMYYTELSASNVSVLGSIAVFTDAVGADFEQHVATVQVVNSNPFSTASHGNYLKPTTAGRTLDVTAGGNAGIDWGNVANPTTALDLSGTTVKDIQDTQTVNLNADQTTVSVGTVSNLANHSLGTVTDLADDAIRSASLEDNAIAAAKIATDAITAAKIAANAITSSELADGAITAAKFAAGALDAAALATDAVNEIADGVLDRNMATGADSGTSAIRTPRDALRALRNRVDSDATQLYVYEEDDTTIKWTASLSTVASTNDHISGFDPNS